MQQYTTVPLDIASIRKDFPILQTTVYDKPLVYMDNGATTQKPQCVIDSIVAYYSHYNSNVHRGVHFLSQKATDAEEKARQTIAQFIGAAHTHEIIFTKGTTDSINTVAQSFGKMYLEAGDEIIITAMEHHSNIVPWQMICAERGASLKIIPLLENGTLHLENIDQYFSDRTKLLACTWVSNTLGTINPVKDIIQKARAFKVPVLLDAAQAVQHIPIDVQALDVDFLVFSGHKIYGPTGIGVLYAKTAWLEKLPPYQGGGSMIKVVHEQFSTWADLPYKFEAGTPNVEGIIALGTAIEYVQQLGIDNILATEHALLQYAEQKLSAIPGVTIYGRAPEKSSTISFLVKDIHPFDMGELLDKQGIAVRTGHHCCQPIMNYYQIPGTVRVSLSFYNTFEEIDRLITGVEKAIMMLS
jgi:cysteine desulfurase/selenocysteine lyase